MFKTKGQIFAFKFPCLFFCHYHLILNQTRLKLYLSFLRTKEIGDYVLLDPISKQSLALTPSLSCRQRKLYIRSWSIVACETTGKALITKLKAFQTNTALKESWRVEKCSSMPNLINASLFKPAIFNLR